MEVVTYSKSENIPGQLIYRLPQGLGSGFVTLEKFSSGLTLYHMDVSPTEPINLIGEMPYKSVGVSFNVTGHSEIRSLGPQFHAQAKSNSSTHYSYPTRLKIGEEIRCSRKCKIGIILDYETFSNLANEDEEPFLPFIKGLQSSSPTVGLGKLETEMKIALNQLISCPYRGKTRALYLEGKMMELLAHKLELIRAKGKVSSRQPRITHSDIERIHYAAELLTDDPVTPPNLTDLAGKIGMSRSKFYQNFKMVFGHSPMNHLRNHRLQLARQLLRQGKHNVTEAAIAVGFNSLSYFTKAFTAEFGVLPRQVL